MKHVSDLGYASLVHQSRVHLFGLAHTGASPDHKDCALVIEIFPASGRRVRVGRPHLDGHSPRHPEPKKRRRRQPPRWPTTRRGQSFGDKQTSHRKPNLALKLWTRQHPSIARQHEAYNEAGNESYLSHHSLIPNKRSGASHGRQRRSDWAGLSASAMRTRSASERARILRMAAPR